MNFIKRLATALLLFAATTTNAAEPAIFNGLFNKNKSSHIADFDLEKPFNIVVAPGDGPAQAFAKKMQTFLETKGVRTSKISNAASERNMVVSTVGSINNVFSDIYYINTGKNTIVVNFTTPEAMNWSFVALSSAYNDKPTFFKKLFHKGARRFLAMSVVSDKGFEMADRVDVINLTAGVADVESVKTKLHKASAAGASTVYMVFFDAKGWSVNSPSMDLVNPNEPQPLSPSYEYSQIASIKRAAYDLGMDIVPIIDIAKAENDVFYNFTGHPIHSTEGVRFLKAFVKEFCRNTGFETICLGDYPEDQTVIRRFIEPVVSDIESLGCKAVMF